MKKIAMLSILFVLNFNSDCVKKDASAVAYLPDEIQSIFSICGGVIARANRTTNIDNVQQTSYYWLDRIAPLRENFETLNIAGEPLEPLLRAVFDCLGRFERTYAPPVGIALNVDFSPESFFAANGDVIAGVRQIVEFLIEDPARDPLWLSIERESAQEAMRDANERELRDADEREFVLARMDELHPPLGEAAMAARDAIDRDFALARRGAPHPMTQSAGRRVILRAGYYSKLTSARRANISAIIKDNAWQTVLDVVESNREAKQRRIVREAKKSLRKLIAYVLRRNTIQSPRHSITAELEITGQPLGWLSFDRANITIDIALVPLDSPPRARARRAREWRLIRDDSLFDED